MKKPILRGYYGGIFFEFVLQDRLADAVVIFPGFPSGNDFNDIIKFFYEKGFHVFVPRYRGSYQSLGVFLSKSPVEDMIDFVKNLEAGEARSLWDNKKYAFKINKKILIGTSFGGAIACATAVGYPAFSHLILQAPVWDFAKYGALGDEGDLDKTAEFVNRAYKNCYRFKFKGMKKKILKFREIWPSYYAHKLTLPILVMHDPNDKLVAFRHTKAMLKELPSATYLEHLFGHKLTSDLLNAYWQEINKFINVNYV